MTISKFIIPEQCFRMKPCPFFQGVYNKIYFKINGCYMATLQPQDIADNFTIEEINTEIGLIQDSIRLARQSKKDTFGDNQATQSTERVNLTELNKELSIWLKAKSILNGTDSSTAEIISANYNPTVSRI